MSKHFVSNPAILNEARDYLDGLLISDGNITIDKRNISNTTASYHQDCKHQEWLNKIKDDFFKYNIKSKVNNGRIRTGGLNNMKVPQAFKPEGYLIYRIDTPYYLELRNVYKRWYKLTYYEDEDGYEYTKYKKIVPRDINMTPAFCGNWYLGDRYLHKQPEIILSTTGFIIDDVIFLCDLLSKTLDIKCNITKHRNIIISKKHMVYIFLDYIRNYKINCYSYKFPDNIMYEINKIIINSMFNNSQ